MIWWALEQRKKYRAERLAREEELRVEALARREQLRAEGRAEGRAEAFTVLMEAVRAEANGEWEELLERLARERGIIPDDAPPQNGTTS